MHLFIVVVIVLGVAVGLTMFVRAMSAALTEKNRHD